MDVNEVQLEKWEWMKEAKNSFKFNGFFVDKNTASNQQCI